MEFHGSTTKTRFWAGWKSSFGTSYQLQQANLWVCMIPPWGRWVDWVKDLGSVLWKTGQQAFICFILGGFIARMFHILEAKARKKDIQQNGLSSRYCRSFRLWWFKWAFSKIGVPQNGLYRMENPIKMDDLGVPLFSETPKSSNIDMTWAVGNFRIYSPRISFLLDVAPWGVSREHLQTGVFRTADVSCCQSSPPASCLKFTFVAVLWCSGCLLFFFVGWIFSVASGLFFPQHLRSLSLSASQGFAKCECGWPEDGRFLTAVTPFTRNPWMMQTCCDSVWLFPHIFTVLVHTSTWYHT